MPILLKIFFSFAVEIVPYHTTIFKFMIDFKKFKIEISAMDAMFLAQFLDLVGNHYDLGDELVCCISRFIHAVNDAGCKTLPEGHFLSSEVFDILGSNGSGKRIK